jgi:uncharacterized protein (TIGR03382 family)
MSVGGTTNGTGSDGGASKGDGGNHGSRPGGRGTGGCHCDLASTNSSGAAPFAAMALLLGLALRRRARS